MNFARICLFTGIFLISFMLGFGQIQPLLGDFGDDIINEGNCDDGLLCRDTCNHHYSTYWNRYVCGGACFTDDNGSRDCTGCTTCDGPSKAVFDGDACKCE